MNKYTEPMTPEVREELFKTRAAGSRRKLATLLAGIPSISYNHCMKALKAAPKASQESNDFHRGEAEAKRDFRKMTV